MKITNYKTTVTLANDFKNATLHYKKGQVFDARKVKLIGLVVVTGQGWNEVIPHDFLGTYEETYNEVTTDGDTKTIKTVKNDVTEKWLVIWKKLAEKETAKKILAEKARLKLRIATVRKAIAYVEKGDAKKELDNLLAEFAKIA